MRDLSEVFVHDDKSNDFTHAEEEMTLPISIADSVIIRYEEKLNNFDFDSEKQKALDIVLGKLRPEEFELDYDYLKEKCAEAAPSSSLKICVMLLALFEVGIASLVLLIIWVVLILDLVILAAEIYFLKKFKRIVWRWKNNKVDQAWIRKIEVILLEMNLKYEHYELVWKFDPDGKLIQFTSLKKTEQTLFI